MDWDKYYSKKGEKLVWFFKNSEKDINEIMKKYKLTYPFARFVWYRTEPTVRLIELLEIRDSYKVLEVGCGSGAFTAGMVLANHNKNFNVTAIDFSHKAIEIAKQRFKDLKLVGKYSFKVADATKLPFPDEIFDMVVSPSVIEHIPEQEKAISEMSRVCKQSGKIIITGDNTYGSFASLTIRSIGGKILRTFKILPKSDICFISNTPSEFVGKLKKSGLEVKFFEFTHFSIPFFKDCLKNIRILPQFFQNWILRLLIFLENKSRNSTKGLLHPVFIVIGKKKSILK